MSKHVSVHTILASAVRSDATGVSGTGLSGAGILNSAGIELLEDIGFHTHATADSSGTTLDVYVQGSNDGTLWTDCGSMTDIDATTPLGSCVKPTVRFVAYRVRWAINGTSYTFSVFANVASRGYRASA